MLQLSALIADTLDPNNLFDNSRDSDLALPDAQLSAIRTRMQEYHERRQYLTGQIALADSNRS